MTISQYSSRTYNYKLNNVAEWGKRIFLGMRKSGVEPEGAGRSAATNTPVAAVVCMNSSFQVAETLVVDTCRRIFQGTTNVEVLSMVPVGRRKKIDNRPTSRICFNRLEQRLEIEIGYKS